MEDLVKHINDVKTTIDIVSDYNLESEVIQDALVVGING